MIKKHAIILIVMNEKIYNRIRKILKNAPGLTQKGLAESMGLNPAAVNRMLYGRRNINVEEIPIIENYLGKKLNIYSDDKTDIKYDVPRSIVGFLREEDEKHSAPEVVPVYNEIYETVDWAIRHPAQIGIKSAFAIYIFSDDMQPRYFYGELVYIHPGKIPEMNRDCLIEFKDGRRLIRKFLNQNENNIYVEKYNPQTADVLDRSEIKAVYSIIGRN